jgi:hypothetical protein
MGRQEIAFGRARMHSALGGSPAGVSSASESRSPDPGAPTLRYGFHSLLVFDDNFTQISALALTAWIPLHKLSPEVNAVGPLGNSMFLP